MRVIQGIPRLFARRECAGDFSPPTVRFRQGYVTSEPSSGSLRSVPPITDRLDSGRQDPCSGRAYGHPSKQARSACLDRFRVRRPRARRLVTKPSPARAWWPVAHSMRFLHTLRVWYPRCSTNGSLATGRYDWTSGTRAKWVNTLIRTPLVLTNDVDAPSWDAVVHRLHADRSSGSSETSPVGTSLEPNQNGK